MKRVLAGSALEHPHLDKFINYFAKQFDLMKQLFLRGMNNEEKIFSFLYPSIRELYDPFQLDDMKKAVMRIIKALQNREKIFIFGDYDVDGMTASAILHQGLLSYGANVEVRLPLRSEGYGLSPHIFEQNSPGILRLLASRIAVK